MGLQRIATRLTDPIRKGRNKPLSLNIEQDLCPVFCNDTADIEIKDLTFLKTTLPVLPFRQLAAIHGRAVIWSGSGIYWRVAPVWPFWPPGFLPVFLRGVLGRLGSVEGGLLLLRLLTLTRPTSSLLLTTKMLNIKRNIGDSSLSLVDTRSVPWDFQGRFFALCRLASTDLFLVLAGPRVQNKGGYRPTLKPLSRPWTGYRKTIEIPENTQIPCQALF